MRKRFLISVPLLFLAADYAAAQIKFQKIIGAAPENEVATSVKQTLDGGYIITGGCESFGTGNGDIYLIKADSYGNPVWKKTFGTAEPFPLNEYAQDVVPTSDSGYIVVGHVLDLTGAEYDMLILKTDAKGNILWTKTFGDNGSDWAMSVKQTNDGGCIVTGWLSPALNVATNVALLKFDASGNIQWKKAYGGNSNDRGEDVQQTTDNGYIIVGRTFSFGAGNSDIYLVKTDSTGALTWSKTYGHSAVSERGTAVEQTSDGGYIISGDALLIKTDAFGNTLWTRQYVGIDISHSVRQTADQGYILAGNRSDLPGNFVLKTDSSGSILWAKAYGLSIGLQGLLSAEPVVDGGYIIAGYYSSVTGAFDAEFYLIKTDSTGTSGCNEVIPFITGQQPALNVLNVATAVSSYGVETAISISVDSGGVTTTLCTTDPILLPVELISFTAEPVNDSKVFLSWATASEFNNDYFTVERSLNTDDWQPIQKISGMGTSVSVLHYSAYDNAPFPGISYYRLKQTDFNGDYFYSEVKAVRIKSGIQIHVLPDPTNGYLNVMLSGISETLTFTLFDIAGRILVSKELLPGNHQHIPVPGISSGLYMYNITSKTGSIDTGKLRIE